MSLKSLYGTLLQIIWLVALLLTGCTSLQKKPLTFISPSGITFKTHEIELVDKYKLFGNTAYSQTDSFTVGTEYNHSTFKNSRSKWDRDSIQKYVMPEVNKDLADLVVLYFYQKKLFKVEVFSKDSPAALLQETEHFFNKPFKKRSLHTDKYSVPKLKIGKEYAWLIDQKWTREIYSLKSKGIEADYSKYLTNGFVTLTLTNKKVKLPPWCGTRFFPPSLRFLKFWNWSW